MKLLKAKDRKSKLIRKLRKELEESYNAKVQLTIQYNQLTHERLVLLDKIKKQPDFELKYNDMKAKYYNVLASIEILK